MAEQTGPTNKKQPEEHKSEFDLSEAGNANKSNEETGKVDGRYFADLDKAILDEDRHKAELEFEPLPSFLLGEEEKTAVSCRPVFTLFINNLQKGINDKGVANVFREYGEIIEDTIKIIIRRGEATNLAKVSFRTRQEAVRAIRNVHKQPPLYFNVVFERRQEARDFQNKKDEERVKFGDEWLEKWKHLENTKEKIVKEYEDKFGKETVEPSNEVDSGSKMDHDDGIPPKSDVKENIKLSCQSKGFDMSTKDTEAVEASNNFKEKNKSIPSGDEVDSVTGKSNSSADSTATFGYELFVPYLAPCPCLECRQPGRMLCSRCQAWYCSLSCQVNNWPQHKDLCRSVHAQGGITLLGEGRKSNKNKELCKSNKSISTDVSLDRKRVKSSVREKGNVSSGSQVDKTRSSQDNGKPSKKAAFEAMESRSTLEIEKVETVGIANTPDDDKISDIIEPAVSNGWMVANDWRVKVAEPAVHIQETIVPRNQWTEILQPISAIESPQRFWVQPKFNEKLAKQLGEDLAQHVATAADIVDAGEGAFRLVEVGGCWLRALVLRVDRDSQEALVRLVDIGGDREVKCSSLLRLPPHLASTPALVVEVAMAGVKPPHGDRWTKEDGEQFEFFLCADLDQETRMWIKPIGFSEGTLLVSMKDHEDNNLAELYVELGLAKKVNQVENVMEIPTVEAIQTEDNIVVDIIQTEDKVVEVIQTEDKKVVESVQTEDNKVDKLIQIENNNVETVGTTSTPDDKISDIIEPVVANDWRVKAAEPAVHIQETIVPRNQWTEILQPISAIESPHRFWVQPKFNEKLAKKLRDDLHQHVATAADIVDAGEGAFRLVEVGGCWHRALVLRMDRDYQEALVRLVDIGGDREVKCSSLLRLPPHLASTPALVVEVAMAGVKPPRGERWTKEDGEQFEFFLCNDLNDETRMWIKPVGFSEGTLLVSIKDQEGNDLAELYVDNKVVEAVQTEDNKVVESVHTEDNKVVESVHTEDNKVIEATRTENKIIFSSGEDDKMGENPNWKTTRHVNINISPREESEAMEISKQESAKNSDGIVSEKIEKIPLSSSKEDDLFPTYSNTPKSIIAQLKDGHVYEFRRAEGHPLSEFGAMCHFDSATFEYIYNDMQREYNGTAQDFGPDNPTSPGDMVVAYCAEKSTFYRAVVLNLPTQDHAEVLLADVGGTEVVRLFHLRVMAGRANNLDEFPYLAVRFFSLDSLSPQAEETMTTDPDGKMRVQVESREEGAAVVGVLNKANTVVAKYKVDAWQYLHPRIGHLFPTEMNGAFPKTLSRHQAVFVSQLKPVKIVDGDTVILRTIGKFACFGMIQLTETEPTFRALKQALAVCEKLPRVDFPPEVGQILAVQKAAGRKMMRAEVVKIDEPGRKATVRCLDYPDHLLLPWSNMTLIPDTALSIPTQCRQMRLAGVPMIHRKLAMSLLQPITASLERPLRLEYHFEDQSMPCVYLYESNGKRINELIISTLEQNNVKEVQDSPLKISTSTKAKLTEKVSSTSMALEYDPANCFSLQIEEDTEVFILSVKDKSNLVHVCSVDVLEELTNLQESLQKIGSNSLTTNCVSSVAVNNVYLAQSADGKWYRAVVLKAKHQKCVAYFPDFGFKEKISFEKIHDFHGEFYRYAKAVPFFASACIVNNMKDENGNRLDISKGSMHMIRVERKEDEFHFIDVLNLQTDKEVI